MANVIRLKRASGSDPAASDLVSGEPAVRTDTGELFFKKDDGSIAKVAGAGGGPDFKYLALRNAANNGAASFPNADFTLVTSGTTSAITPTAANTLLVSVNGVIQKPNTGTSTPSQGFALSGSTIKFGANITTAPDFILYQESGGIGEPSDDTVSEVKLKVSNSPVNGYFLSAQSGNNGGLTWAAPVATSCTGNSATATALATARTINGTSFDGTANITVTAAAGTLTGNTLNSSVTASSLTSLGDLSGLTVTGNMAVDTNTLFVNSSNNRVGIGTTSPSKKLKIDTGTVSDGMNISSNEISFTLAVNNTGDSSAMFARTATLSVTRADSGSLPAMTFAGQGGVRFNVDANTERMRIDTSGRVLINKTSTSLNHKLQVESHASDATAIAVIGRSSDDISQLDFYENDGSTKLGEIQYRPERVDFRHRVGYIAFATGGTTERMRIDSSGRVGIAQTPVSEKLEVSGAIRSTSASANFAAGAEAVFMDFIPGNRGRIGTITGTGSARDLAFNIGNLEKMRITTSGNVGIGKTNPSRLLDIETTHTSGGEVASFQNNNSGNYGGLVILAGQTDRECRLSSAFGSSFFTFYTQAAAGASAERMRINSNGAVMVGGTLQASTNGGLNVEVTDSGNERVPLSLINQGTADGSGVIISHRGKDDAGNQQDYNYIRMVADDTSSGSEDGSIRFWTLGGGTLGERLRINSSGNVGIGTTSPSNVLDVQGSGHSKILIGTTGTGHATGLQISHALGNAALQQWQLQTDGTADGNLVIRNATSGNKVMIFDSDVYGVSIGGIDPEKMFELQASNHGITDVTEARNTLRFRCNDSTATNNQPFGTILWTTNDSGNSSGKAAFITATDSDQTGNGQLIFGTGNSATERMRIDSSGGLFLGITSAPNSSSGGTCLRANDAGRRELLLATTTTATRALVEFINGNGSVGSISVSGSNTSYNTSSDYRLKENVTAISDGIARLKTLKPSRFNFKADSSTTVDGFLAHEVTAVPEAITGTKDEVATEDTVSHKKGDPIYQSIDQSKLVPLLVAALQEAIVRIEALEAK